MRSWSLGREGRNRRFLAGAALALTVASPLACNDDEGTAAPYIIVLPAGWQPEAPIDGTIVAAQTRGGETLGLRGRGCTVRRAGIAEATETACVPVEKGGTRLYFSVLGEGGTCVVHAELYDGASEDATPSALLCPGSGVKVAEIEVPIARIAVVPVVDDAGSTDSGSNDAAEAADGTDGGDAETNDGG